MKNEVFKRAIHAERTSMYKERLRETEKISKSSKLFLFGVAGIRFTR